MDDTTGRSTEFDVRRFRNTLAKYASGVTVISGWHGGEPVGFTCQSFYSVSLEPPLVSFSVTTSSTTYPRLRASGHFAVNVLADDQRELSDKFARSGTDKWSGVSWSPSPRGIPVIDGTLTWLDCEIWDEHRAGDHFIVVGHVDALGPREWPDRDPLIFYDSTYCHLEVRSRTRMARSSAGSRSTCGSA
ncbi:flavin reductase family protein [Phytoactinopolyspora mesophila]|uniref:flavin reductase family protein n=1 Tax=Phytoactinopolyspora mesophila TaxID=2650750 RepID=UPI001C9E7947